MTAVEEEEVIAQCCSCFDKLVPRTSIDVSRPLRNFPSVRVVSLVSAALKTQHLTHALKNGNKSIRIKEK